eukprot:CAMPEP_0182445730 /NCGR_PEP_ID=MMETSP1172-20130603/3757_1 /TAXON_ID=708627 /ORGANISM="Timspurckia oligopyrenoides, Strain CCMP3278" /LENGTH=247 /DNA_ID=CAMNT_0024641547 /DNA_START=100 /DNA_END=840 /DNA_ORIENTATION=-
MSPKRKLNSASEARRSSSSTRPASVRIAAASKQKLHSSDHDNDEDNKSSKKPHYAPHPIAKAFPERQEIPNRGKNQSLIFPDHPEFRPNLTPKEVLQLGSFGGTYWRPIYSSVNKQHYKDQWKEFPLDWFEGLNIPLQVTSKIYRTEVNLYGVKSGADLEMWESKGWISDLDPYGWFQWYCRFYLGRRSDDDERQIARGLQVFGPTGRFRTQLMNKIIMSDAKFNDKSISPVIRQTLQHWGYQLTED